ncbi:MAG: hypothetical protein ACI4TX_04075, partial [Christensenellales bacterium]
LIAFSGMSSIMLNANGYDGASKMIKSESTVYNELSVEDKDALNAEISENTSNVGKNEIVYDIILFETSDYDGFFYDSKISRMIQMFNDDIPNNAIFSVHEYFYAITYGKVNVYANFYYHKSKNKISDYDSNFQNLILEFATYTKAKLLSEEIECNHGAGNAYAIVFSSNDKYDYSSRLWAHAYLQIPFVSVVYEQYTIDTLCHEILHNFNIRDLYTTNNSDKVPVGEVDMMANHRGTVDTFLYNKKVAGMVDVSNYGDDKETEIETITESGRYTLQPTTSFEGTRAYKFGMKENDKDVYFMVEYRKASLTVNNKQSKNGLLVYRVNENYKGKGNISGTFKTYEVYVYRKNNLLSVNYSNAIIAPGEQCGGLNDQKYNLYYEDKSIAKFLINNIVLNQDGSISFDFTNFYNTTVISGQVLSDGKSPLSDAIVSINGIDVTTTDSNGYFTIMNVKVTSVLSVRDINGKYTFNSITVEPNTANIKIYPDSITVNVIVRIVDGQANKTYEVYKSTVNSWELVGTFKGNSSYYIGNEKKGQSYKVVGYCVDSYIFKVVESGEIKIQQVAPTIQEEENKSTTDKIVEAISKIPEQVPHTLNNTINSIANSIGNALNKLGRYLGF